MIKISLEIKIENYEEILNDRNGFFSALFTRMISRDMRRKVEDVISKNIKVKIGPALKKILQAEGVKAEVHAYIEKRG